MSVSFSPYFSYAHLHMYYIFILTDSPQKRYSGWKRREERRRSSLSRRTCVSFLRWSPAQPLSVCTDTRLGHCPPWEVYTVPLKGIAARGWYHRKALHLTPENYSIQSPSYPLPSRRKNNYSMYSKHSIMVLQTRAVWRAIYITSMYCSCRSVAPN